MKRVLTTLVKKDLWYKSFPYTAHIHTHVKHFLYSTVFIQLSSMLSGYPASSFYRHPAMHGERIRQLRKKSSSKFMEFLASPIP